MKSPQRQPGLEHKMKPEPDYMPRFVGSERLAGKVALITGGDSGIGRATAILYAREGAKVAIKGQDLLIDYASTKGAILAFLRAMSSKLASKGILVNGVAPGPIWTPLIPASFPKEAVERFGQDAPLGRPGQPSEVAPCLLFLACEDSSYMTGQVLHPNGGTLVGS